MRWQLYAGIGVVFVLGGVAGGLLGTAAERDRLRKMEREGPAFVIDGLASRLEEELKLDPGQTRRVREIYAATRPELVRMESERRRHLRQMLDHTQPQILEVLSPPQKERFLQLQEKLEQRLRLHEPAPGAPAHEPGDKLPPVPHE